MEREQIASEMLRKLGDGLIISQSMGIEYKSSPGIKPDLEQQNLLVLNLIDAFEHHHTVTQDIASHNTELHRIENKLDMLLAMMGQLLQQSETSKTTNVYFSHYGLVVELPASFDNQQLEIRLYPDQRVRLPLTLYGEIVTRRSLDETSLCCMRFDSLSADMLDALDKWIFRVHRRSVAQSRH